MKGFPRILWSGMLLAAVALCAGDAAAAAPLRLTPGFAPLSLLDASQIYIDSAGAMDVSAVAALPEEKWRPAAAEAAHLGYTDAAIWIRTTLHNSSTSSRFTVELRYAALDEVALYASENSAAGGAGRVFRVSRTGDRTPAGEREILHRLPALPLQLEQDATRTVYLRVKSQSSMRLPLTLYRAEDFARVSERDTLLIGLFLGVLAIMSLYNLFLAATLRSVSYIYYVIYIFWWSMFQLADLGIGALYIWPGIPLLQNELVPTYIGMVLVFALLFARRFLRAAEFSPWGARILTGLLTYSAATAVLALVLPYRLAVALNMAGAAALPLAVIPVAAVCYWRGFAPARYFILAWFILVLAIAYRVLVNTGVVESGLLGEYGLQLGSAIEIVMLSMALGDRVKSLESEKERLQTEALERQTRTNERLRELDRLKDEFLANTSHELRTPLHGIIGLSESLLDGAAGEPGPAMERNLRLIAASGRRLASLVNDILDYSRLRHGDFSLKLQPVDLHAAIDLIMAVARPLIGGRPVELIHDRTPVPPAFADEDRLAQILYNLIGNALKFTRAGRVVVSAQSLGEFVEISVSDTGIGVPPDKRELIFEPFAQADGGVAREYGGSGLGLSISKTLVELQGGRIRVESADPEGGSRFAFTLPVSGRETQPTESSADELVSARILQRRAEAVEVGEPEEREFFAPTAEPDGRQILIVDDDPVNLQVLRNHLTLHNYAATEASSGQDALDLLDGARRFDLALIDAMMPGLSGYEACRRLRERYSPSELPVIILTANNRVGDLIAGLNSGANDYLVKPFDQRELLARVRNMLELKKAAQSQSRLAAFRHELELARRLQQSLLPARNPEAPGLRVAARYRAMQLVGGDFYDFRRSADDRRFGVLMADVSGHGVPAALVVSMLKIAFGSGEGGPSDAAELFVAMNRLLLGNIGDEFVTACYALIDLEKRMLITSNAGHPALLVWSREARRLSALRPTGRVLGLAPDARYHAESFELAPGDRIVLYTDGAFEAERNGEDFGEQRLRGFIEQHADLSADEFSDSLIRTIVEWCGGEDAIGDDIALVVIDVES